MTVSDSLSQVFNSIKSYPIQITELYQMSPTIL